MAVESISPIASSKGAPEAQVNLQARQSSQAKAVSEAIFEGVQESPEADEDSGRGKALAIA